MNLRRPRDSQRQRVYDAEYHINDLGYFEDFGSCMDFVNRVTASSHWHKLTGGLDVVLDLKTKGSTSSAYWQESIISLAPHPYHFSRHVILHELAHLATHIVHENVAGHGPEYCDIYLNLVKLFMGRDSHSTLLNAFIEHRVRWTPVD